MNSQIANDLDQILTVLSKHFPSHPLPINPALRWPLVILGMALFMYVLWMLHKSSKTTRSIEYEEANAAYWRMVKAQYDAAIDNIDAQYDAVVNGPPPTLTRTIPLVDKRKTKHGAGWVYLIKGDGAYKIGIARDPVARMADLQTSTHVKLELVHKIQVPDMRAKEYELHLKYADKRAHGEWFKLTPEDVADICALQSV